MAGSYLIDSNVIIHYTGKKFPLQVKQLLDSVFDTSFDYSVISRMEVLVPDKTTTEGFKDL